MKARLLIVEPDENEPPPIPDMVLEQDGVIYIDHTGWCFEVMPGSLEEVTAEDIRQAKGWERDLHVFLSEIREVPSDLTSEATLNWVRQWWHEVVAECLQPVLV